MATKPNLSLLPINDIVQYLKNTEHFITKSKEGQDYINLANNTEKVGELNQGEVAKCIKKDAVPSINNIGIRDTVLNALMLNGKDIKYFASTNDLNELEDSTLNITKSYIDEINNLRTTISALSSELVRRGYIENSVQSNAFNDCFVENDIKYNNDKYAATSFPETNKIIISKEMTYKAFDIFLRSGDIISITQNDSNNVPIRTATAKIVTIDKKNNNEYEIVIDKHLYDFMTKGETVDFNTAYSTSTNPIYVSKSIGHYDNGAFNFSHKNSDYVLGKEGHISLYDDSEVEGLQVNKNFSGFATCFKVPASRKGFVTKVSIFARAVGTPGDLKCYIIRNEHLLSIKNVATESSKIVAMSNSIPYVGCENKKELTFDFKNADGTYSYLSDERYCLIVTCNNASIGIGRWEIDFGYHGSDELQTNNSSYVYMVDSNGGSAVDANTNSSKNLVTLSNGSHEQITKYDLLFEVVTREKIVSSESGYISGLYSTLIKLPNNSKTSIISLQLQIAREGYYKYDKEYISPQQKITPVVDPALEPVFNPAFNNNNSYGINAGEKVIIGDTILKQLSSTPQCIQVTQDDAVYVGGSQSLYRLGYKIFIRPLNITFNKNSKAFDFEPLSAPIEMDLAGLLKTDKNKLVKTSSDKILYKASLPKDNNGKYMSANAFELQIVWNSNYSSDELKSYKDLIGRIYELSVGFTSVGLL